MSAHSFAFRSRHATPRFNGRRFMQRQSTSGRALYHIENYIKRYQDVTTKPVLPPISNGSFADFPLPAALSQAIKHNQFLKPTPIQEQVIPAIFAGKDVIGIANTGTGKTAAFLIPLIAQALADRNTNVLILAPTRELAIQIKADFEKLAFGSTLKMAGCIGGLPLWKQQRDLNSRAQFIVGTPGRLMDLLSQRILNLSGITKVVLDEVDRMLDMGFIADVKALLTQVKTNRQTMFFTATLPSQIEQLCRTYSHNPIVLSVKTTEAAVTVKQEIIRVTDGQGKLNMLQSLLAQREEYKKVLIFGRTKRGVQRLADDLSKRGYPVGALHGNKSQPQRQRTLDQFRQQAQAILVATDVAARGIDVSGITHVINYDIPETFDDYIHRIGRTGRAGHTGIALTFA